MLRAPTLIGGDTAQCRSCAPLRGRGSVNAATAPATPAASALGWWALVTTTVWENDLDSGVAFTDMGWLEYNTENDTHADCGNHAERAAMSPRPRAQSILGRGWDGL